MIVVLLKIILVCRQDWSFLLIVGSLGCLATISRWWNLVQGTGSSSRQMLVLDMY